MPAFVVAELGLWQRLDGQQSLKPHSLEKKIVDSCINTLFKRVLKKSEAPFNIVVNNMGFSVRSQKLSKPWIFHS